MKSTDCLIKAQEDVDNGTLADIAAEVAAEATVRSQHIRQETRKLTKSYVSNPKDGRVSLSGGVMQDSEADVQDIRKRSVHQLDLSDRLPWLKSDIQPRIDEDDERTHRDRERLTSPDSGVMDHLSEATESLDGNPSSIHSVTSTPHLVSKSHKHDIVMEEDAVQLVPPPNYQFEAPNHLQNGELPLRDYPILPPPKDYPSLEQQPVARLTNLAGDAYTVQEAKLNSRPVQVKTKAHYQGGPSDSPIHSHQIYS